MFRLRRSRVVLVLAVFAVVALYHFTSLGHRGNTDKFSVEHLKSPDYKDPSSTSETKSNTVSDEPIRDKASTGKSATTKGDPDDSSETASASDKPTPLPKPKASPDNTDEASDTSSGSERPSSTQTEDVEEPKSLINITKFNGESATVAQTPAKPVLETLPEVHGQGRFEITAAEDDGMPKIHWTQLPEHFPIPTESLIPLPTGKARTLPKLQSSKFPDESPDQKADREGKLDQIKKTFAYSWQGYRKNAWMQDELSPVSGDYRNPFCGWAATLVDSLDSLWMLGMKEEFEEAVGSVSKIDFTTSIRNDLPLFEVTIRYLGGLVGAYDISGTKYKVLLDKAVELAEVLMGAFDTPNRMPMTFYLWKPTFASQPHRAKTRVVMAEIGSLSLEFTRLAQITKEAKYYDAIARITDEFERWQNNTKIPGLWPKSVDASGCKKPEPAAIAYLDHSAQKGPGYYNAQVPQIPNTSMATTSGDEAENTTKEAIGKDASEADASTDGLKRRINKRRVLDGEPAIATATPKPDCVLQGLASPPGNSWEEFSIGGMADSTYEYLPKEYMLLGGLEEKYQSMYEMAADATKENLIFRPMIEDQNRHILIAGQISKSGKSTSSREGKLKAEQAHLTCFAGGMFAVGARLFDRKDDIDIAKRLTDGCVWAYEMTPTGIMPEHFLVVPCEDPQNCPFNETLWYEKLDPYHPRRGPGSPTSQMVLDDRKESSGQAGAKIGKPEPLDSDSVATDKKVDRAEISDSSLRKRQLGDIENDQLLQTKEDEGTKSPKMGSEDSERTASKPKSTNIKNQKDKLDEQATDKDEEPPKEKKEKPTAEETPTPTSAEDQSPPVAPVVAAYTPPPIPSQEEYAKARIRDEKLPKGVERITSSKYLLRPEALESVFIMYRVTGEEYWRKKGWNMFKAIQNATHSEFGASAISDVMSETPYPQDEMESFWLAETLKYLYLLFSEPDYYSLDDYVLNTEAHPFKRPKQRSGPTLYSVN
ncbi:MAG: hypothetical protein Q9201_004048 [Fulgogasparrea decipioides]